ncbi:MAG: putative phospholipid ABC transporter-binding protein MlaB [Candidatus Erwinia impunctatus]|nr:putative phospholipid ABC transporter-binding protein MlaB [Culicoides impunctatus]
MDNTLQWRSEGQVLRLNGWLKENTLQELWQKRQQAMSEICVIDVSGVEHIDSAGLALLVHLSQIATHQETPCRLAGVSDKLRSLIMLYNLQNIIKF